MASNKVIKLKKINTPRLWAITTIVGVVVYVIIDIVLTLLRPDYSWLHNAESDFGRGPYFWLMDINFILRCLFSLALAAALMTNFPKTKSIKYLSFWLSLWAVMSGLLAFFADNPYGYPTLKSGSTHLFIAFVAFVAILYAVVASTRLISILKWSRQRAYTLFGLAVVASLCFILQAHTLLVRAGFRPHSLGGLYERLFLACVFIWEVTLALYILKDSKQTAVK